MRHGNKKLTERLAKLETANPPVDAVEALRRNLLYAMFKGVTGDDVQEIVAKQVEKAKAGDGKAARLIIDMVKDGGSAPTHMQQAIVVNSGDGRQDREVKFISDAREKVAILISEDGPQRTEQIAKVLHISLRDASHAVDHDWFQKEPDGYHITAKGMADVVIPLREAEERLLDERE
jgi:hypothetical protein